MRVCDFYDQRGIYILYGDYGPYYVGLTARRGLGVRLREHLEDSHEGKWDRFSWFGFRGVRTAKNTLGLYDLLGLPHGRRIESRLMIREMEALLIHAMGLHNIHRERFPAGETWTQVRLAEREQLELTPGRSARQPRRLRNTSAR